MGKEIFRRRSNGTVDIDYYRRQALTLREQTRSEIFRGMGRAARPLCAGLAIIAMSVIAVRLIFAAPAAAELPNVIAVNGETLVTTVHAVGAQIYECKPDSTGQRVWRFREPIATLVARGKTVGRHYAGPNWEMSDGSTVGAKAVASAPGASANDIPLLKLSATASHGKGELSSVTTIQRLNTSGGYLDGACDSFGAFRTVPYTADYVFYRNAGAPPAHRSN